RFAKTLRIDWTGPALVIAAYVCGAVFLPLIHFDVTQQHSVVGANAELHVARRPAAGEIALDLGLRAFTRIAMRGVFVHERLACQGGPQRTEMAVAEPGRRAQHYGNQHPYERASGLTSAPRHIRAPCR